MISTALAANQKRFAASATHAANQRRIAASATQVPLFALFVRDESLNREATNSNNAKGGTPLATPPSPNNAKGGTPL